MSQVSGELIKILRATLSDQADVRREAENSFLSQWVPRPAELFPQLVTVMLETGQYTPEEQSLAAVFFRRWINRESSNESSKIKSFLLTFIYIFPFLIYFSSCILE